MKTANCLSLISTSLALAKSRIIFSKSCFRLLNIGERMSNEFHLIIGIVSLILISFPIGIFITQIREKNYESAYLKKK